MTYDVYEDAKMEIDEEHFEDVIHHNNPDGIDSDSNSIESAVLETNEAMDYGSETSEVSSSNDDMSTEDEY